MRNSKLAVVLVPLALALACGGGGGGNGPVGGSPTPVVVTFAPDMASPVANTVALLEASKTGDTLVLRVTVTDVSGVYGTAFEIVYDDTKVEYDDSPSTPGYSPGTVFEQGGVKPIYTVGSPVAGRLIVSVARPGSSGTVDVSGTKSMVQLRFRGLATGDSRLDFQNAKLYDASQPPAPKAGIAWKGGSVTGS